MFKNANELRWKKLNGHFPLLHCYSNEEELGAWSYWEVRGREEGEEERKRRDREEEERKREWRERR
jgi:hypothetical protein